MPRSAATRREFLRSASALAAASVTQPYWFSGQDTRADDGKSGLTVYMDWDMEGVSGLFTREQVWFWENGVRPEIAEEGRKLLVADVNSAAAAAIAAGADRVIVFDTHHGGGNLRREEMLSDSRITYQLKSRDKGAHFRWMAGLDTTVTGLMLMAHHAKAGTERAFLPHTWMAEWADFTINGKSVGEIGIEACNAGHWGVP